jgi:hypothetical protein
MRPLGIRARAAAGPVPAQPGGAKVMPLSRALERAGSAPSMAASRWVSAASPQNQTWRAKWPGRCTWPEADLPAFQDLLPFQIVLDEVPAARPNRKVTICPAVLHVRSRTQWHQARYPSRGALIRSWRRGSAGRCLGRKSGLPEPCPAARQGASMSALHESPATGGAL